MPRWLHGHPARVCLMGGTPMPRWWRGHPARVCLMGGTPMPRWWRGHLARVCLMGGTPMPRWLHGHPARVCLMGGTPMPRWLHGHPARVCLMGGTPMPRWWHGHLARVSWAGRPCHDGCTGILPVFHGLGWGRPFGVATPGTARLLLVGTFAFPPSRETARQCFFTLTIASHCVVTIREVDSRSATCDLRPVLPPKKSLCSLR